VISLDFFHITFHAKISMLNVRRWARRTLEFDYFQPFVYGQLVWILSGEESCDLQKFNQL
jgi:hypothetical protein